MKNKNLENQVVRLSDTVGAFMSYWGFKRIHGQAWTLIYLSPVPLSATKIVGRLRVSKALVSLALRDLGEYGLIRTVSQPHQKVKDYVAESDIMAAIRKVLKSRENELLRTAQKEFDSLAEIADHADDGFIDRDRLKSVGKMVQGANLCLRSIFETNALDNLCGVSSKGRSPRA